MSFQIELRSSFASDSPRLVLCIFSSSCSDVPFIMSFNKLVNVEKKKKKSSLLNLAQIAKSQSSRVVVLNL